MEFQRGDVFECQFPNKILNALYTPPPDHTQIDQQKALGVCLTDSRDPKIPNGQALVVPVVDAAVTLKKSKSIQPVVIPLKQSRLSFLPRDSYALTYQPIACNKHWMGSKVGHISMDMSEMQRIDVGLLMSTGTYKAVREEIMREVTVALLESAQRDANRFSPQVMRELQESAQQLVAAQQPGAPAINANRHLSDATNFQRGDVFYCSFPQIDTSSRTPPPDYSLKGSHMGICLTNANDALVPDEQVLIVPISTAESAVQKGYLKPTHIPVTKTDHPFLHHDSYALTFQPASYNRHWLRQSIGKITPETMDRMDLGLLLSTGTYQRVSQTIQEAIREAILQKSASPILERMNFDMGMER